MPEGFSKMDIWGTGLAVLVTIVGGVLLQAHFIDFFVFIILLIIGLVIPIGRVLYPFLLRDILHIEEEKKKVKKDVWEDWALVWKRLKDVRVVGATQEMDSDKPSYLPEHSLMNQKFSLYIAEVNLNEWIKTVKQGLKLFSTPTSKEYKAVLVFDIYSGKVIEENWNMTIVEWEKKFPERAEAGYYSKAPPVPRIIIPPALAGLLPLTELGGAVEVSGEKGGKGGGKK